MQESLDSNSLKQTLSPPVRTNGLWHQTKIYSTETNAVNRSKRKSFRLSHILFDDSIFVTALIIGLIFGMLQRKYLDKYTGFCVF
jgi:hypothetical protein